MKKITERLSSVTVKKYDVNHSTRKTVAGNFLKISNNDNSSENNYAFHTIGDDDL